MSLLLLSGCAAKTAIEQAPELSVEQREMRLRALETFEFRGGLGIWTDEESLSARVHWLQIPEHFTLNLTGPLGIGDLRLTAGKSDGKSSDGDNSVRLQRGDTLIATGQSADNVLQRGLGLAAPVPLEELRLWVRGLPGNAGSVVRDSQGRLASVRYNDAIGTSWQARFLRYSMVGDVALPELITASGGPYSVRLVLKNWQTDASIIVPEMQQSNNRLPIPSR